MSWEIYFDPALAIVYRRCCQVLGLQQSTEFVCMWRGMRTTLTYNETNSVQGPRLADMAPATPIHGPAYSWARVVWKVAEIGCQLMEITHGPTQTSEKTISSSGPGDKLHCTWLQKTWSTSVRVMACCLTAPSHYLNQCRLNMNEVLWYSPEGNFTENAQDYNHWNMLKNCSFKLAAIFIMGKWVNK